MFERGYEQNHDQRAFVTGEGRAVRVPSGMGGANAEPLVMTRSARTPDFLEVAFERVCAHVQITSSQFDDARRRYSAVSEWLAGDDSVIGLFTPAIYPQGSLSIGTTVRPVLGVEFDLDLVVELTMSVRPTATVLYKMLWDRLGEHVQYTRMREAKNRCTRLKYADQFHLDLLPAVRDPERGGTAILIPDREKQELTSSDPKAYAAWFEREAIARIKVAMDSLGIALKASVEPLQEPEAIERKAALKRTVQLLKVARNVAFASRPGLAPVSIVMTTLAAQTYRGEPLCVDAIHSILDQLWAQLHGREPLVVVNPVNPSEILSRRWNMEPASYVAFREWVNQLRRQLDDLAKARGAALAKLLKEVFGDRAAASVFSEEVAAVEAVRAAGGLRVAPATGAILWGSQATGMPVRSNTFYGSR